jgi:Xaa-Pro aminopeptidase
VDHGLRRARLLERIDELGVDAFLVTRMPNVRYLSGFTGSNGQVVLTREASLFVTDGRYVEQSRHEVADLEHLVDTERDLAAALAEACARLGVTRAAFEGGGVTYELYEDLRAKAAAVELVPTRGEVERLRWVKEPEELRLIERAQGATDAALRAILGRVREGVTELELALELELAMRRAGADGVAFETIVAFGENAAEPHHDPTDRGLRRGDVVKLDFGGLSGGYRADMTRTLAFGEPDPRLREAYEVVRAAQQAGVDAIRAGARSADVDEAARGVVRDAGLGELFTHGTGHGVGLEIHEGPWLRRGGRDVLPAGAVVTVEPGVYIPELGGVRIEDMVEVTDGGARVIPRSSKELLVL